MDKRYITSADIMGAATLMHGYNALEGFGITLKRNQTVEITPIVMNNIRGGILCFSIHIFPGFILMAIVKILVHKYRKNV
jgi:hypothetical protein